MRVATLLVLTLSSLAGCGTSDPNRHLSPAILGKQRANHALRHYRTVPNPHTQLVPRRGCRFAFSQARNKFLLILF